MALDVYDPCPCGSGKKLKFCCSGLVAEMEKIAKLRLNNQPNVALQMLEELDGRNPGNPWITTSRAAILFGDHKYEEVKVLLEGLLEKNPDHIFGLALYATAVFTVDGFDAGKSDIHRAFQRCTADLPEMVGGLAMGIAGLMLANGRHMASRQHLALAMRLMPEKDRQDIFLRLLEFDSNAELAYPLRSVHALADYSGSEQMKTDAAEASRLCDLGCYEPAARLFGTLAEQEPDSAALWQNVGLCRAWNGEEKEAAEAMHLAARLHEDFPTAVECETVAQLLDQKADEEAVEVVSLPFEVESASRLLTVLAEHDRFARLETPPPRDEDARQGRQLPIGVFAVLDRAEPTDPNGSPPTLDSVANVLAEMSIFNGQDGRPAEAFLVGFAGEPIETAQTLLQEAAGTLVEAGQTQDEEDGTGEATPRELYAMDWRWHFAPKTPLSLRRDLDRQKWQIVVAQVWPETPLAGLGGKAPREVAGDPDQKTPLTAALFVLDAHCDQRRHVLDLDALRERLQLDELPQVEAPEDAALNTFSALRLRLLPPGHLTDAQLSYVLNRALLIHHDAYLYDILTEVLSRPSCTDQVDLDRVYVTMVELCRDRHQRDEALEWIRKGRELAKTAEEPFEQGLQWEMREITLRLERPDDPALALLLRHIWDHYGAKLPQLRDYLQQLLDTFGVPGPWQSEAGIVAAQDSAGSTTAGGIWTPAAQETPGGEKKLWLPGQGPSES